MAKQAVFEVLNSVLGKYVSNLDVESLSLSIWSGYIELTKGLSINTSEVNRHKLMQASPVMIQSGTVGSIRISIPWTSLASKSVTIQISNIELIATRKNEPSTNNNDDSLKNSDISLQQQTRQSRLDAIDELDQLRLQQETILRSWMLDQDSATSSSVTSPTSKSKETFTGRLIRRIIENIQVEINDVHMCICSNTRGNREEAGSPDSSQLFPQFFFGVKLQKLSVCSTDSNRNHLFVDRAPDDQFLFKSMEIEGFGVYLSETEFADIQSKNNDGYGSESIDLGYFIHPLSFTLFLRQFDASVDESQGDASYFSSLPEKYSLKASLPTISMVLSQKQFSLANFVISSILTSSGMGVAGGIASNPIFPQYRPFAVRPTYSREAAKDWWHYAFKCVHCLQYGYPQLKSRLWKDFMDKFRLRVKYIALYKRYKYIGVADAIPAGNLSENKTAVQKRQPLSENEFSELMTIECNTDISVQGIVTWRTLADAQVRLEQQRQTEGKTSSTDNISAVVVADLKEDNQLGKSILSIEELKQLDLVLIQQEELKATKEATYALRPLLCFNFILGSLKVSLRTSQFNPIVSMCMEGVETSYSLTFGGDVLSTFAIASIVALDEVTRNSLFPEVIRVVNKKGSQKLVIDSLSLSKPLSEKTDDFNHKLLYLQYCKWVKKDSDSPSTYRKTTTNQYVKLCMVGLEFVASPLLLREITTLFVIPDAIDVPTSPCTPSRAPLTSTHDSHLLSQGNVLMLQRTVPYIAKMYATAMAESISSKLVIAWNESHKVSTKLSIDIAVDAPVFVVPKSCVDSTSPVFVFDLGYLRVFSVKEPARSIEKMFMESCHEVIGKDEISAPFPSKNYRVEIRELVILLGQSGMQDWCFTDVLHASGSFEPQQSSVTLVEPLTFSLDLGLESTAFGRDLTFVDCILQKVRVQVSIDNISDMIDIAQYWAAIDSQNYQRKKSENQEVSFIGSKENAIKRSLKIMNQYSVSGMDINGSSSKNLVKAQFQLKAAGLCIRVLADKSYLETRLSCFHIFTSVHNNGSSFSDLHMGCFCLSYFWNEYSRTDVLFHTNIDRDMSLKGIAQQRTKVHEKMDEIEDLRNRCLSDVFGAKISLYSNVTSDQTLKSFHSQMSGVVVHWYLSTIEKVFCIKNELIKRLSTGYADADFLLPGRACESEADTFSDAAEITTKASILQALKVRLTVSSAGLFLYSPFGDSFCFYLTMSNVDFSLDTTKVSTLHSKIDIGDLIIGAADCEGKEDKILGLSSNSQNTLLSAVYRRGPGQKVDGENENLFDAVASIILSPMKCVYVHQQIQSLLCYFSSGILGSVTSQAASSAASAAKDVSATVFGAQYYSLKADGLEVLLPESYHSSIFVTSNMERFNSCYQVLDGEGIKGSKTIIDMQGFKMSIGGYPIIPDGIDVTGTLCISPSVNTSDLIETRAVFHVSHSCFFTSKADFIQVLKTIEENFGQKANCSSCVPGSEAILNENSFQLAAAKTDHSLSSIEVQFEGIDLFLCEYTRVPLVCLGVGQSQVVTIISPSGADEIFYYDFTLRNFEVRDMRPRIDQAGINYLIRHSHEFAEEDLFHIKFSRHVSGKMNVSCILNGLQICYLPDLISVALSIFNLSEKDKILAIDQSISATQLTTVLPSSEDVTAIQDEKQLSSFCCSLLLKAHNVIIILVNTVENHAGSSAIALKGSIDVQADTTFSKLQREIINCRLNLSGENFEMYSGKLYSNNLLSPVQLMEPMTFFTSFNLTRERCEINFVFASDVVIVISTLDYLLFSDMMSGLSFLQSASSVDVSTVENQLQLITEIKGDAMSSSAGWAINATKLNITCTLPFTSVVIINDMFQHDQPLFRVFLREFSFGSQFKIDGKVTSNTADVFFDCSINLSFSGEYFDNSSRDWEPLLEEPWEVSLVGRRAAVGSSGTLNGKTTTTVDIDARSLRFILKENMLEALGQTAAIVNCISGSTSSKKCLTSDYCAGPYSVDNFSGFRVSISVSEHTYKNCENGVRKIFNFEHPRGSGVGRKRIYGTAVGFNNPITFTVGAPGVKESTLTIDNICSKSEGCMKMNVLSNGLALFTEISVENGVTNIKLLSPVTFYNCTQQGFLIALKFGQFYEVIGDLKSYNNRIGDRGLEATQFPGLGVASSLIDGFFSSDVGIEFLIKGTDSSFDCGDNFDWHGASKIMLPSLSTLLELKKATSRAERPERSCSSIQLVESIGATVMVVVDQVQGYDLVKVYIQPRVLLRNDLPVSILFACTSMHCFRTGSLDKKVAGQFKAVLAPLDEYQILSPYSSINGWIHIENAAGDGRHLKSFSNVIGSVTIPLFRSESSRESMLYHIPSHDGTTYGSDIFISEITPQNGIKVISVDAPIVLITFTGDVFVEKLSREPDDSNRRQMGSVRGYSRSGVLLSNFFSLKSRSYITLISDSNALYRLVEKKIAANGIDCSTIASEQNFSQPFHLSDIPIGNNGAQSTGLFWEDGSFSGYFMYCKLFNVSDIVKSEVHLIPEYVVFNNTSLSLSISASPYTSVLFIGPHEAAPIRRDETKGLVIKVTIPEMNSIAGPVRVDGVGMRICPINNMSPNDDSPSLAGTFAIQTAHGSPDAHLVVKIGKMATASSYHHRSGARGIVTPFHDADALVLRMNFKIIQATLLKSCHVIGSSNYDTESSVFASLGICNSLFTFERGMNESNSTKELSAIHLWVGEFSVKDFSQKTATESVIGSAAGQNFLALRVCIPRSLFLDVLTVESVDIKVCVSPSGEVGKVVIDTNENFIWELVDSYARLIRSIKNFKEFSLNVDTDSEDITLFNEPPKNDFIYCKHVKIAPFTLEVSFDRCPNVARYKEVRDVKWSALANYAMRELKFSLKNCKLYFSEYEIEHFKGSFDQLVKVISVVYLSRIKYKWMVLVSSVSIDDWSALAGRNSKEDQYVTGVLGLILGATLGFTIKSAGEFS